jgi:hypothetical protein
MGRWTRTIGIALTFCVGWTVMGLVDRASADPTLITPTEEPQGDWVGAYGSDGWILADANTGGDVISLPAGVTFTVQQANSYTWAVQSTDVRALESADSTSRSVGVWWEPGEIQLSLHFADAYSGLLSMYILDWDSTARREDITIDDGTTTYLAEITTSFHDGLWVSAPVSVGAGGTVSITAERTGSYNAVIEGIFLGDDGPPLFASPSDIQVPAVTGPRGDWLGRYGAGGRVLANWSGSADLEQLPPGVDFNRISGTRYMWQTETGDARALQASDGSTRRVAVWYGDTISLSLDFDDGYEGTVSIYSLDWDSDDRRQKILVSDGTTDYMANLSESFQEGAWVTVPVSVPTGGSVTIDVIKTGAYNAVISGVFLDDGLLTPLGMARLAEPQGDWVGNVGSDGHLLASWSGTTDLVGLPSGVTASVGTGNRYPWATSTTERRALQSPDETTRKVGVWYGDLIEITLTFTDAYRGALSIYSVDWDSNDRRQTIEVEDSQNIFSGNLSTTFHDGAWFTAPVNVEANGTVTVTVNRTGAYNAVVSGIFLGNTREVSIPEEIISDPLDCALAGGNMFFDESTYIDSLDRTVTGCWYYRGCVSTLPSIIGYVQELACENYDLLVDVLEFTGKPAELFVYDTNDGEKGLALVGDSARTLSASGEAGGAQMIEKAGTRYLPYAAGVMLVSGEALVLTRLLELDEATGDILAANQELYDAVRNRVLVDTVPAEQRDQYRTALALTCVAGLKDALTKTGVIDVVNTVLDLAPGSIDADGAVDGVNLCESLPVYMPGDATRKTGVPMPHTAQHAREALGTVSPPDPIPAGLKINPGWIVLTKRFDSYDNEWKDAILVENSLDGSYTSERCDTPNVGRTCDDFPYRSANEGGPNPDGSARASLKLVPSSENSPQGGDVVGFYTTCGVGTDDPFLVIPMRSFEGPTISSLQRSAYICGASG